MELQNLIYIRERIVMKFKIFLLTIIVLLTSISCTYVNDNPKTIELELKNNHEGAPVTAGIPFPSGALYSPDRVRLFNSNGNEIPVQVTEVSRWDEKDPSIKWIWVFFFTDKSDRYYLEYGRDVHGSPLASSRIRVINNMRHNGYLELDTGPLRLKIDKLGQGFLDVVEYDNENDGFDANDTIATGPENRGTFLDIIDAAGLDRSKAKIIRTRIVRGSGPLHMVARIDGEYLYSREDNNESPFTIYLHTFAGKSYVKVYHTMTYTGEGTMHPKVKGEHALIARSAGNIVDEDELIGDPRWLQANDQIHSLGLALKYRMDNQTLEYISSLRDGHWYAPGKSYFLSGEATKDISLCQKGPEAYKIYPYETSSPDERISGFSANMMEGDDTKGKEERSDGWLTIKDAERGISVGMRNFFEEYPSELQVNPQSETFTAYSWTPKEKAMNFARYTDQIDGGMVDNFASGIAKTSEYIYYFHNGDLAPSELEKTLGYVLNPVVIHAKPQWYANSKVFGNIAPRSEKYAEYERFIDYKFKWMAFNQNWEPWYGMFDYGDRQTYYYDMDWMLWNNNEPGQDYMRWMQFIRTGDDKLYYEAQAASRHSMDVDNVHWPMDPEYIGDSNYTLDYFKYAEEAPGNPYLGIGARESRSHWATKYSAHVWVAGWLMDYYLNGYHRGLDVARVTADTYSKRIWGEHNLTGRRLYLSVWNVAEVYDATKDAKYLVDLKDRVQRMIRLQERQGGNLVLDRYGYSQAYAMNGLRKYLQIENNDRVKRAIVEHARWVRDVPPRNHSYESFLATITSLIAGYEYSHEKTFLDEAIQRSRYLIADEIKEDDPFGVNRTQRELYEMLESVDHMPERRDGQRPNWKLNQGSRVFGWTHANNVPYLLYYMNK